MEEHVTEEGEEYDGGEQEKGWGGCEIRTEKGWGKIQRRIVRNVRSVKVNVGRWAQL